MKLSELLHDLQQDRPGSIIYLDSSVALAYLLAADHRTKKEVPDVNRLRPQASALMPPEQRTVA
jgi:hypothetical protein